ncbi:cyanophycin synthetase [Gloeomargarita lithophora Alchichica-D10]|uniref:Cyanophycin synthetase n=1 Tax=Gloeomargarita lithophora Alchichica-D10 TaxID=1188229 RepID=A0A1J0AAK1_9CYAN|nr:cyanophycin synthetase [Gloeomargarita lithophora]APB32968.1 cyanophycin synthetase [Gloeomargarita lithophora Alchichica-D10]
MKILQVLTLRGPNYWSIRRHRLIVLRLDLEDLDERFSDELRGFYEALVGLLPSLEEHFCSPGCRGGFLQRLREGTLMGHVIEHVALELQSLAGMPLNFGRTRETRNRGVYNVVYEYQQERAGRVAGRAAVRICATLADGERYPQAELAADLAELRELKQAASLGLTTDALIQAAEQRGIPWVRLPVRDVVQLGWGVKQRRLQAAQTDLTGMLGVELAGDKDSTKILLQTAGIPVPEGDVIRRFEDLEEAIDRAGGFPLVIKPLDGNHGRGITLNIRTYPDAAVAYDLAKQSAKTGSVIVERYHRGGDYRVLVVGGQVVAAAQRVPAQVVGDGRSTISELVARLNQDPRRGEGHDNVLTRVELNQASDWVLRQQGHSLDTILRPGEICYLKNTANLSTGGMAIDCTDTIHPENRWLCERAARWVGLDIAGIDLITPDITQPLRLVDGVVVEVNAAPGLRMHLQPSEGTPRNVSAPILDLLFPGGSRGEIPIVAITGTNGKTTTTRLTAHLCKQTGKTVGFTTTDGTYIGDYLAEPGDNTGPQSARLILNDPAVELAVLESARGGILRSGLAFPHCQVGVVLNVSDDHLGSYDIETLEQMASVKSVVAEVVHPDGLAVLNAEDELVVAMAQRVKGAVGYFSLDPEHPVLRQHLQRGGLGATVINGEITLLEGEKTIPVLPVQEVPLTLGGTVRFMTANALAAVLAAYRVGVNLDQLAAGLRTFAAGVAQTPGRMNLLAVQDFHVLIDYAHNPHGYRAVGEFVAGWQKGERIGVIGAPGDRRDEDLREMGRIAAGLFDRLIIKEDDDTRGRPRGEAANWLQMGVTETVATRVLQVILDETEAIETALKQAKTGDLVVVFPESVQRTLALVLGTPPQ